MFRPSRDPFRSPVRRPSAWGRSPRKDLSPAAPAHPRSCGTSMPESPWPTRRATHRKTGKAVSQTRRGRVRFLRRISMSALWPTLPALVLTAAGRSSCYDMSTVRAEEYSPRQSRRAHFKSSSVPLSVGLRRLISTLEPRRPPQVCQHVRTCGQSAGGEIACLCLQWCAGVEADVTVQAIELDDVAV